MKPRFTKTLALLATTAALSLNPFAAAHALPVVNGDFSDPADLAGWTAAGEPTGEFAQLETDGSPQRTLEQTFALPATSSMLAFDFAFSTQGTPPVAVFPDSFAASLVTGGDFLDILVVDLVVGLLPDPSGSIDVALDDTVTLAGFTPFSGGTAYSGRISLLLPAAAVLGQDAAHD